MIIDAHCHLGSAPQFHVPDVSWQAMLRLMDQLGIDRAICSHLAMLSGDRDWGWEESLEAHRKSRGRILLYTVFNPVEAGSLDFVRSSAQHKACVGIKIHPSIHRCPADDPRYRPVWEFAAEKDLPILAHSWCASETNPTQRFSQPGLFETYAREYPAVRLILGHAGGRYEGHLAAAALAKTCPNVYLDLAGDSHAQGLVEYLVEQVGSTRILFGSDITWIDPRTQLGRIFDASIRPEQKEDILWANAMAVFGIPRGKRIWRSEVTS